MPRHGPNPAADTAAPRFLDGLPRPRPSAPGPVEDVRLVGARGPLPDAPEQPRSRGGGEPRAPRRLRRNRARRALVGRRARDPRDARIDAGRRDALRPVRPPRRGVAHARGRTPRAALEQPAGPPLGELGRVPPPRGDRAHDVRPDDGRVLDLHRHAGDRPGHVRDVRGLRALALQRRPLGEAGRLGGARRHGRRAAARRVHGGRDLPRRRRRRLAHREAARDEATSTAGSTTSTRPSMPRSRRATPAARSRSARARTRSTCFARSSAAASSPTS